MKIARHKTKQHESKQNKNVMKIARYKTKHNKT